MFYRNIYISNYGKLSIRNNNFLFTNKDNQKTSVPLDDINSIVIDSPLVSLTTSFISSCAENNIAVYVCDKYHLPNSIIIPFAKHHKWLKVLHQQINWKQAYKKRVWREIVEQKILNQKIVLDKSGKNSSYIKPFLGKVKSGDKDGVEATIARFYFKELFGEHFNRRNDDLEINSLLNYGYALVRGNIARSVTAYGFIPALGLNHKNHYNGFNLVDDLIEPFRPLVDLYVFNMFNNNPNICINKDTKAELIRIFESEMMIQDSTQQIPNCIDIMVRSLRGDDLNLPCLI